MKPVTMRDAIRETLRSILAEDETVFLFGQDIGAYGGSLLLTDGLFNEFGGERVIDAPLSEYAIMGAGVGAALMGMKPILEIMFGDFTTLIADQLINNAAKVCYSYDGKKSCPLVVRMPFGAGGRSGMHHSQNMEAMLFNTPGLKIVMPATPADAAGLLRSALVDPNPVVVFEHKRLLGTRGEVPERHVVPIGKARVAREGSDMTVVSWGAMVGKSLEAAKQLQDSQGISIEVIDLRTISPLDMKSILASVKKTNRLLLVHEACATGAISGEIAFRVNCEAIEYLDAPIQRVAAPDTPVPFAPTLEDFYIPSVEQIVQAAAQMLPGVR
jgi:pyruvate dehydrogenase E1 component beta subunit